ncbi:pirin family protein [Pseudoalteromonas tunicata]|uniref:pirin family protein n=1 Tax=Pseudoalteromonas tunicata TaxID=314281 RepID=UPI00273D7FD5|nr:pirin family protein [Pseudoalteromonas tunicata]MDP5215225.1 pirin family protein [Pseudoalteromonas tunicata]
MKILKVIKSQPSQDGDGVKINRIAAFDGRLLDPYLMIDELKSDDSQDFMGGFPPHPHRGIETFTYIIKGGFEHQDQMGNKKAIRAGDVQWMSTGSGVLHSEMPLADAKLGMHGFQIWLNMAAKDKMRDSRYGDSTLAPLPSVENETGAQLKALAGSWHFADQAIESPLNDLSTGAALADFTFAPNGSAELSLGEFDTVAIYIHTGSLAGYSAGYLLLIDAKQDVSLLADQQGAGILLLCGRKINEPVAHLGPFVMNTQDELKQAVRDYQNGFFGQIN